MNQQHQLDTCGKGSIRKSCAKCYLHDDCKRLYMDRLKDTRKVNRPSPWTDPREDDKPETAA